MYSGTPRHTNTNPRTPAHPFVDLIECTIETRPFCELPLTHRRYFLGTQKREATQNQRKSQIEFESKVSAELSEQKSEISQKISINLGRRRPCRDPCGVSGKMVSCKKKKVNPRVWKINEGVFIGCSQDVLQYLKVIRSEYLSSLFFRSFAMLIL